MATVVLGLDIGGANLKAATADRRAMSVPFALWKQSDRLPAALADLVAKFPEAGELAVTMTGELCDCFETKREGVNAILDAVEGVAKGRRVRVWSTDGDFVGIEESRRHHLKVAAANWHALATFAGRWAPTHGGLLLDIGSTTTDIIPIHHGIPSTYGLTDWGRLQMRELVYVGVKRTPVFAVFSDRVCAEYFATTQDVYVVLGILPEDPEDRDSANGRPMTVDHCTNRLARVLGADLEELPPDHVVDFAVRVDRRLRELLLEGARHAYFDAQEPPELRTLIVSGVGEFLARTIAEEVRSHSPYDRLISLNSELGPAVSACAPAYALAVLATERRP